MARRDPDAFAEFVAGRSTALHRTAYLMVGDANLAQDVVQEALIRAWMAWPRLRNPGAVEGYARRAITTIAIDWSRKKSSKERPSDQLPDRTQDAPQSGVADRQWLWQAVQTLPARQRAAIVLRFYSDLSEAQTADAMDCAVGTVKSQVHAALRTLREQLGPTFHDNIDDLMAVTR